MNDDTNSVKYLLHIQKNVTADQRIKMTEDLRDVIFKIETNCSACYFRQTENNEKIPDILQNQITTDHIVRSDSNRAAGLALYFKCPELEKAAEEFAFKYCGKNKKMCEKGRELFSKDLYMEIKKSIQQLSEENNNGSGQNPSQYG